MGYGLISGQGVPVETATAARKIYNIQHIYLRIGDQLESILEGIDFSLLDSTASLNNNTIFRLALVTAFQCSELLPDPLAEQATMKRMDWKYALRLPIRHPGLSAIALCQFRKTLLSFPNSTPEFTRLLTTLGQIGLFPKSTNQTITHQEILATVCNITRLYWLNQGMRGALSALASVAPDWLGEVAMPHWYEQYKEDATESLSYQLAPELSLQRADRLGMDAYRLLSAIRQQKSIEFTHLVEINQLSRLFTDQFVQNDEGVHWRIPGCLGCGRFG